MGKSIGLYGGSFDPIHFGHLNLAICIMEARGLDEVWFCPAAYNPHKPEPAFRSDAHRLKMVALAIEGEKRFRVTDIELRAPKEITSQSETARKLPRIDDPRGFGAVSDAEVIPLRALRPGPSYTIDTLHQLIDDHKGEGLSFAVILGDDAAHGFCRWRRPEEIIQLAKVYVGTRNDRTPKPFEGEPAIVSALEEGVTPTRVMEISSTEVRQRLKNRQFCGHLVPGKVLDYIVTNRLYL